MVSMTSNPERDYDRYLEEMEDRLMRRPKCSWCHEHIQDDYAYEIDGETICVDCMDLMRISIDD